MEKTDIASLVYLGLLGIALVGSMLSANRHQIGKMAQYALIWGFVFVGAVAAIGLWPQVSSSLMPQQSVVLGNGEIVVPRHYDGHYYLTLELNGSPIQFVIDTGATDMVLTPQDAARAGINVGGLSYNNRAMTANGMVQTASIRLAQVSVAGITDHDVSAVVNGSPMQESLLGMTYLNRFDRIAIEDGRMLLTR